MRIQHIIPLLTNTSKKKIVMQHRTLSTARPAAVLILATLALLGCSNQHSSKSSASTPIATTQTPTAAPAAAPNAASAAPTPSNNRPIPVHIVAGFSTDVTAGGTTWLAGSNFFPDGQTIERPDITIATGAKTGPDVIYKAERYSMTKFTYAPVPNGDYTLKLHFCETFEGITEPGQRVFGYTVKEDGPPVKDFDVFATAGGALKPVVKAVPVTVTNQRIEVEFTPQVENPQINAIEIFSGH